MPALVAGIHDSGVPLGKKREWRDTPGHDGLDGWKPKKA
jgi:hypothetical protein